MADIETEAVATFVGRAKTERQFPLSSRALVPDVLAYLNLLQGGQPTYAALLLFGCQPQRFVPAAEVRCMHFHGTEVARPAPSYQVFKGPVFAQVDRAVDFALGVLRRGVGTRAVANQATVSYEIPPDVIREAIVNAVAHRDYTSSAAVQVSVFADRLEVWNPGTLPPPLTPERLRRPHSSHAHNPRIAEALFLARYIEKFGTGTLMMIRETVAHALPEPDFEQRGGEFVTTVWRHWLTDQALAAFDLNPRQRDAVRVTKTRSKLLVSDYREMAAISKPTASRDLDELVQLGILLRVGTTGRGTYYTLNFKGLTKGSKCSSLPAQGKGSSRAQSAQKKTS